MPRLELVESGAKAGTLVELAGADGKIFATLLVGKKYGSKPANRNATELIDVPKGRYVEVLGAARVSLVADSLDDAQPKPEPWLSKDFVQVSAAKSIAVLSPAEGQSWSVTRENPNAPWQVAGASPEEQPDSSKTFRLNQVFSAPSFIDVLPPDADPVATGLDQPTVAKIDTFDGFHYELKIGRASHGAYPLRVSVTADLPKEPASDKSAKPESEAQQKPLAEKLAHEQEFAGRVFLVPTMVVGELLRSRAELLADKPAAPPSPSGALQSPLAPAE
jgi:hypothetical protein